MNRGIFAALAVSFAVLAETANLVLDGEFEKGGSWHGQYTSVAGAGRTGTACRLLKNAEDKGNCDAISLPFAVVPGTPFTLSGHSKGGAFYAFTIFQLTDGSSKAIHVGHRPSTEWREWRQTGTVPENAESCHLILRTFNTKEETLVDDVAFQGENQKGVLNLLKNGDFEVEDGKGARHWRGIFTRATGEGVDGTAAARTLNINGKYSEANSNPFPVRPGAPFTLTGLARGKASGTAYAYFYLKDKKPLAKYTSVPASDNWRIFRLAGTIPEDAESCSVLLRTSNDQEPLFFDNVSFLSSNPIDETIKVNGIELKVPGDAPAHLLTAREELAHYLPLVLEGELKVGGVSVKTIQLADNPAMDSEEWRIHSQDGCLFLTGGMPRGTLYATYHFLEDCLGVHWWNAREEFVPPAKAIDLPALDKQGRPHFAYRDIFRSTAVASSNDLGRWPARNRLNRSGDIPFSAKYGGAYTYGPPYFVHTFARYIHGGFHKTNPEFFSMVDGKRNGGQYSGQLCLTNAGLRKKLVELMCKTIRNSRAQAIAKGVQPPIYYDLSMNDGNRFCECENCLKLEKASSITDVLLDFINEIADGVGKEYPDVFVTTLAYGKTVTPPVSDIRPRDNVVIRLCNPSGSFLSIQEPRCDEYREQIAGWAKICKHLTCWEYDIWTYPLPNEFGFAELCQYYDKFHFDGLFFEKTGREPLGDFYDMKAWLLAKVMENPYDDLEQLRQIFLQGFYGAAAPFIDSYRRLLAQAERKSDTKRKINRYFADNYDYIDLETLLESYRLFDQALKAVDGDEALTRRVTLARFSLDRYHGRMIPRLMNVWKAQGKKAAEYPVNRDRLAAGLARHWLPYADIYKDKQAIQETMRGEISILANMGSEANPVKEPPEFQGKTVRHFTPSSLILFNNPNMQLVKDPEARDGCAFEVSPLGERGHYFTLPFAAGCYDRDAAVTTLSKSWDKIPDGNGYQWFCVGRDHLHMRYYIYLTRSWEIQAHLNQYLELGAKDLEIWFRAKFVGPLYHPGATGESRIYIDSISCVELSATP
ncbi:MAG: DUF4838 domain-containing protein [Victivallales bacterium]|nr:DUF4838 domain-containing protein [Victivallales bacterium]